MRLLRLTLANTRTARLLASESPDKGTLMKPWEKRLKDLAHLLSTCAMTYFDPDLFRMNVNQFLQTSRTVTFIIQKNKDSIPDYCTWYPTNIEQPWRLDALMTWAKDSRNQIEKEGDLELHSTLRASLIFSYLREHDEVVETGNSELLHANVKRLIRIAQRKLPTGISDAAVIKIERHWVTASLSNWELLHALSYIYSRMYKCCFDLATHLGYQLDGSIPAGRGFDEVREEARQVRYIKLHDRQTHSYKSAPVEVEPNFIVPDRFRKVVQDAKDAGITLTSIGDAVSYYASLAKVSFEHYGSHIPIAFLFDDQWNLIDMLSTHFADQADKYIFWRTLGERAARARASGVVWIAESWVRNANQPVSTPIRNMPIVGERLHVMGFDRSGRIEQIAWTISRPCPEGPPTLVADETLDKINTETMPFFFVPVMRSIGMHDPTFVSPKSAG